jgi:tetratricopeptide (TPR) repeat protein
MGKYPEALELAKQALDLRKSQEKESEWRLSTYLLRVGRVLSAEGNHSEAVPYYERVVKIWSALSVPDHPDVAEASLGLGLAAGTSGRYEDMATNCNHALSIAEKGLDPKHPELAAIHGCLADYYAKGKQDISKALAEQSQAVKILKNAYSRPHPDLSRALGRYADLLEQAGKETEAQAQRSRASEINKAHAAQEAKPKLTAVTQ